VAGLVWLVLRTAATDQLLLGFGVPAPLGQVLLALPLVAGVAATGALAATVIAVHTGARPPATGAVLLTSGASLVVFGVAATMALAP
jgi:hypothetical protein